MPATIYVTGNVTNSIHSNDLSRFDDGPISPLHHLSGGTYLAQNLRSAVTGSQALRGGNTILLEANQTYTLSNETELEILYGPATALTIRTIGNKGTATIDAQQSSRIFGVYGGGVTNLSYLKLINGSAPEPTIGNSYGGAIFNSGTLVLFKDQIDNNNATAYGGGAEGFPNWADGGGIYNNSGGSLSMTDCTLDGNTALGADTGFNAGGAEGGGLFIAAGSKDVNITASTFSNNRATGGSTSFGGGEGTPGPAAGGAIGSDSTAVVVKIVNSTFTNNAAYGGSSGAQTFSGVTPFSLTATNGSAYGGAIFAGSETSFLLVNDTIAYNQANAVSGTSYGGGIGSYGGGATIELVNSIVAQNSSTGQSGSFGPDVHGAFQSLGHNLVSSADGASGFNGPDDQSGTTANPLDAGFNPAGLANNGGPTETIALEAYSPAINTADNDVTKHSALLTTLDVAPLTTDQRGPGFMRKVDGTVDIGAYEFQMNLNKFYAFASSRNHPVTLNVPAPGLLLGSQHFPLPGQETYEVELVGNAPGRGTQLTVFQDGSFTFTVPPRYRNIVTFQFRVLVNNGDSVVHTNLVFTATIRVNFHGFGRGSAGDYLPS